MPDFIYLASQSPRRRQLLEQLGVRHELLLPNVDGDEPEDAEAIEVVLCWGWIDGICKGLDEKSFLQRYTCRRKGSVWSQVNRDNVERLVAAGLMQPQGQAEVDLARADGRWDAAYVAGQRVVVARSPCCW